MNTVSMRDTMADASRDARLADARLRVLRTTFAGGIAFAAVVVALVAAGASSASGHPTARAVTLRIIFPEGFTVRQMADRAAAVRRIAIRKRRVTPRLTGTGYAAAAARTRPPSAFRRHVRRRSIEGFLFPALYEFGPRTSARDLIADQLRAFRRAWRAAGPRSPRARARTPYEVVTIASMIERETVASEERALVSAVIYNRLARDMPLAIDATLRYGLRVPGTRPLTRAHLRSDSPYNTRRFRGLPPTPIANPGLASLRAAARPARVGYLYYVRKPDGVHHFFTADEEEFCRKAREYGYGC